MTFQIPDSAQKWLAVQRPIRAGSTEGSMAHNIEPEMRQLAETFPDGIKSILDIGCGVGLTSLWLRNLTGCKVDGLDGNGMDPVRSGWLQHNEPWNNTEVTRELWDANGGQDMRIYTPDNMPVYRYDLLVSVTAWGWHFPVETYDAEDLLKEPGYVSIDVRRHRAHIPSRWKPMSSFRVDHKRTTCLFRAR